MTEPKTDPSVLPQFGDQAVPWVTRWSHEISRDPYSVQVAGDGSVYLSYRDEKNVRGLGGLLWQREGLRRGGEPQYSQVSTYRQRASMKRRLCQICGTKIEDSPIRWLMAPDGLEEIGGDTITMMPPTCSACIPLSLELCPNLKKFGYQILKVTDYEPWGVYGEVIVMKEAGYQRFQTAVPFNRERYGINIPLTQVFAKQLVVKLNEFEIEEVVPGRQDLSTDPNFYAKQIASLTETA